MAEYSVQQVVATGCTDALVAFRLTFPNPVWEIHSIQKTVLVDTAVVTLGSALLQGRLRACYTVAVPPDGAMPPPPLGTPLPPEGGPVIFQGPLQAVWAESPFQVALALPEAEPGMDLTLTAAHVVDQAVHIARVTRADLIQAIDDQSLIHLALRLLRPADLHRPDPPQPRPARPAPPAGSHRAGPPKPAGAAHFQSRGPRP